MLASARLPHAADPCAIWYRSILYTPLDPERPRLRRSAPEAVQDYTEKTLEGCGASLEDVVSITAWLADIGQWEAFDAVYREVMRPPYPTRTTVGAGLHGVLVEITAVAVAR